MALRLIRFTSLFILLISSSAQAQNLGNLNGFVKKAKNQVPLQGVTIKISGTDKQAMTDSNGFYRIRGIETKSYTIEATSIGFKSQQKFDIEVTSWNTLEVNFDME